jgi:hypothetical protein
MLESGKMKSIRNLSSSCRMPPNASSYQSCKVWSLRSFVQRCEFRILVNRNTDFRQCASHLMSNRRNVDYWPSTRYQRLFPDIYRSSCVHSEHPWWQSHRYVLQYNVGEIFHRCRILKAINFENWVHYLLMIFLSTVGISVKRFDIAFTSIEQFKSSKFVCFGTLVYY